jgi:hypothetical protein
MYITGEENRCNLSRLLWETPSLLNARIHASVVGPVVRERGPKIDVSTGPDVRVRVLLEFYHRGRDCFKRAPIMHGTLVCSILVVLHGHLRCSRREITAILNI